MTTYAALADPQDLRPSSRIVADALRKFDADRLATVAARHPLQTVRRIAHNIMADRATVARAARIAA